MGYTYSYAVVGPELVAEATPVLEVLTLSVRGRPSWTGSSCGQAVPAPSRG
jgi:hypothetical protein